MKILIIGGGIGGLAAAGFLEQKGFEVTLIERAPEFKNIGFGITIYSNGRRLLRELGVDDEITKEGYKLPSLELADVYGRPIDKKAKAVDFEVFGEPIVTIERSNLHGTLARNLKSTKVLLGTTIKKMHQDTDRVHVELMDGSFSTFDLVIGADGIRSAVREEFFGRNQAKFYGWSARSFWVPPHIPVAKGAIALSKARMTLAFFPIYKKCFAVIYEYNPKCLDHLPLVLDDFLPYLLKHGWTKEHIADLAKEAKDGHQFYDHLRHIPLGRWYKKRIVLLGDARHGFSPVAGMGGSMAIEDAFVLADELAKADPNNIELALKNYSKRRTARLKQVMEFGHFMEEFYFIKSNWARVVRDFLARFLPKKVKLGQLEKILEGTI